MDWETALAQATNNATAYQNALARQQAQAAAQNAVTTTKQPSTLEQLFGGLAKGIGDVGKGIVGVIGTGITSAKDMINGTAWDSNYSEGRETDAFKKWLAGTDDIKDAQSKLAGTALNGATTLATAVLPGLSTAGTAAKVATSVGGNALAGAIGGAADELEYNGSDATLEGALKRAAVGGTTGALVGGMNKGISKAIANGSTNKLVNNAITQSNVGRGALSGAVGGAVGAGGMTALNGGGLDDSLSAALSGATSGAVSGGVSSAARNVASKIGSKLNNAIQNNWEKQQDRSFIKAVNKPNSVKGPIYLGEVSEDRIDQLNEAFAKVNQDRVADGLKPVEQRDIVISKNKLYLYKMD